MDLGRVFHFRKPSIGSDVSHVQVPAFPIRLSGFIDDHHIELQALGIRGPAAAHLTVKHSSSSAGGEDHLPLAIDEGR